MDIKEALAPVGTNLWQSYTMDVRQRSTLGGVANENLVRANVKKLLAGKNESGYVFNLEVSKRTQNNTEGIRAMEEDMARLQKDLVVQTNFEGLPIRILNLWPIRDDWENQRKKFRKKYQKQERIDDVIAATDTLLNNNKLFTENFIQSEIGSLFFPPVYGSLAMEGETCQQQKEFTEFFGSTSLPLKLTTTLKKYNSINQKAQILRKRVLDEENFDHYNARKFFRGLADNIQLAVPITADYMETYDLDKYHGIGHAGQLFAVRSEALYSYEQIVRITPITQDA